MSQQEVEYVMSALRNGANYQDPALMQQATTVLANNRGNPTFNTCLAMIASTPSAADDQVRAQAGLALKQNIKLSFETGVKPNLQVIKQHLMEALGDKEVFVRNSMSSCISQTATQRAWPTIIEDLVPYLQKNDQGFRIGIFTVLRDVCEDCPDILEDNARGQAPALRLIQTLIEAGTKATDTKEITLIMESFHHLLWFNSSLAESPIFKTIEEGLLPFLQLCQNCINACDGGSLSAQDQVSILKETLGCYKQCLFYYDRMKGHGQMGPVLNIIFTKSQHANAEISLAAMEFWNTMMEYPDAITDLRENKLLPDVCTLLLEKMQYSAGEVSDIMEQEQDPIKPKQRSRKKGAEAEEEDDDDTVEQWTVRNCAGRTLDQLAAKEGERLLTPDGRSEGWFLNEVIIPKMGSADWKVQESAILAFGAIAIGCFDKLITLLPGAINSLLGMVKDGNKHFLVRSMTYWTLGRYARFITESAAHFVPYLEALLAGMTAENRKVQECAVSSFSGLLQAEAAQPGLLLSDPVFIDSILTKIQGCLQPGRYTARNLVLLFGAIPSVVVFYSDTIAQKVDQCILAPLMALLTSLPPTEVSILPSLLTCLARCAESMHDRFISYMPPVFERCLLIVGESVQISASLVENPDRDVLDLGSNPSSALNLVRVMVSTLVQSDKADLAVKLLTETKYTGTNFSFLDLAMMPIENIKIGKQDEYFVESVIAVLADNLMALPKEVILNRVFQKKEAILAYVSHEYHVAGDASWLLGEMVSSLDYFGIPSNELVQMIAQSMVPLLMGQGENKLDEDTLQYIAVTLGKCGMSQPAMFAPSLGQYFTQLLSNLGAYCEDYGSVEKTKGFLGVLAMLKANGLAVLQDPANIKALVLSMNCCFNLKENVELLQAFLEVVQTIKQTLGPQEWSAITKQVKFPAVIIHRLR